jgi:hypothetical protein
VDDYRAKVEALVSESRALENGVAAKVVLLEDAVRLADMHRDVALGYWVRDNLIEATTFSGFPDKSLVTFAWCLSQFDRNPHQFDERGLLWKYKWILNSIRGFPQIPWTKIAHAMQDFKRRLRRAGYGMRPLYKIQLNASKHRGDWRQFRRYLSRWEQAAAGDLSDCRACDLNAHCEFLVHLREDERALEKAAPILQGNLCCAVIPQATFAEVLLPLVRLGRLDEAALYHQRGYRLVSRNCNFLSEVAQHLTFLCLTDNLAEAVRLSEKHLAWSLETSQRSNAFDFYLAVRFLTDRLEQASRIDQPVRVPRSFRERTGRTVRTIGELKTWVQSETDSLAARFDARNGTKHFARRIADLRKLAKFVQPFPLAAAREKARQTDERARSSQASS